MYIDKSTGEMSLIRLFYVSIYCIKPNFYNDANENDKSNELLENGFGFKL